MANSEPSSFYFLPIPSHPAFPDAPSAPFSWVSSPLRNSCGESGTGWNHLPVCHKGLPDSSISYSNAMRLLFRDALPEVRGRNGITFHRNPLRALQVNTGKDLAQDAKHQGLLIKRKILGYEGKREAILSNRFYIHNFFWLFLIKMFLCFRGQR